MNSTIENDKIKSTIENDKIKLEFETNIFKKGGINFVENHDLSGGDFTALKSCVGKHLQDANIYFDLIIKDKKYKLKMDMIIIQLLL